MSEDEKENQKIGNRAALFAVALLLPAEPQALKPGTYLAVYLIVGCQVLLKALRNIKEVRSLTKTF